LKLGSKNAEISKNKTQKSSFLKVNYQNLKEPLKD